MPKTPGLAVLFMSVVACTGDADRAAWVAAKLEAVRLQGELDVLRTELADARAECGGSSARVENLTGQDIGRINDRHGRDRELRAKDFSNSESPDRQAPPSPKKVDASEEISRQAAEAEVARLGSELERLQTELNDVRSHCDRSSASSQDTDFTQYEGAPEQGAAEARATPGRPPYRTPSAGTPKISREASGVNITVDVRNPVPVARHAQLVLSVYRNGSLERTEVVDVALKGTSIARVTQWVAMDLSETDQVTAEARIE